MSNTSTLQQLQRALQIAEQIAELENELKSVLAGNATEEQSTAAAQPKQSRATAPRAKGRKQRTVSPEARARMAAAQRSRRNREKRSK